MNIIHIFGITILLMGGTDSLIEDAKTDKNIRQKILLRKLQILQPEQEAKPSTWNEVLADVLVNKIRIFSFKNQDKEDMIKEDSVAATIDRTYLVNLFSNVLVIYKKFIYDTLFPTHPEQYKGDKVISNENEVDEDQQVGEPEDVIIPPGVIYEQGPKSEVEFVEPKYHGKITLDDVSSTADKPSDSSYLQKRESRNEVNALDHTEANITATDNSEDDPNSMKKSVLCGEGLVRGENGNCVKNNSRLLMAVPFQCPFGYRMDFLGNCRKIFRF